MELNLKGKGDLAELKVATDLISRGYKVALPYGEDWDYDLILCRGSAFERVQVKYSRSRNGVIPVRCHSHSLNNGKVRATKRYTAEIIDWLAVYDSASDRCYYVPARELAGGMSMMHLRVSATRNGQVRRTRPATSYSDI